MKACPNMANDSVPHTLGSKTCATKNNFSRKKAPTLNSDHLIIFIGTQYHAKRLIIPNAKKY